MLEGGTRLRIRDILAFGASLNSGWLRAIMYYRNSKELNFRETSKNDCEG
jgi:hypothetical protein